jgi:hypothetical protein
MPQKPVANKAQAKKPTAKVAPPKAQAKKPTAKVQAPKVQAPKVDSSFVKDSTNMSFHAKRAKKIMDEVGSENVSLLDGNMRDDFDTSRDSIMAIGKRRGNDKEFWNKMTPKK